VLTQLQLRRRAVAKFGDFAQQLLFSEAGLEQATRLPVAAWHAGRYVEARIESVADIGCGIGADSLAFASLGMRVEAIEADLITAALATFNLAPFSETVSVRVAAAETLDYSEFESLWFDPARRELDGPKRETRRVLQPEDFSPSLDLIFEQARLRPTGVKLSPALDRDLIPADCEAQWVSHRGDLVELTLWFGKLARPAIRRSALMITDAGAERFEHLDDTPRHAPIEGLGQYIFEPDSSLVRSQLMGELAHQLGLWAISPDIAYLSANQPIRSPWLRGFRVVAQLPLDEVAIRSWCRENDIGALEIKKRGVDLTAEQLRPKLKLAGSQSATLVLTRIGETRVALACQPL
jgi:SAM-dependent methyltransferase